MAFENLTNLWKCLPPWLSWLKGLSRKQEIMSLNLIGASAGLCTLLLQVMKADPLESRGLIDASIPEDTPDITKG